MRTDKIQIYEYWDSHSASEGNREISQYEGEYVNYYDHLDVVKELKSKLRDIENVLSNQTKVNAELYQDNKELREQIEDLKKQVKKAYFDGYSDAKGDIENRF